MIPLKLTIKNFLSYGQTPQTIDFKDYPLICLSGRNGHGKSALLDAMTWALWGQARKLFGAAKPDSGLLRLGQTSMMVLFEFSFNGQVYRVRREFAQTKGKPYAALDIELRDEKADRFISLTDKTIRATQTKIEELIGLDYDTFVNSAFLRQGQSNEFSQKNAKERKEIIANILGLSRYERFRARAQEQIRLFQDEQKVLSKLDEHVLNELQKEAAFTAEKQEKGDLLKNMQQAAREQEAALEVLEQERVVLGAKKQEATILAQQRAATQLNAARLLELFRVAVQQWRAVHAKHLLLPNIDLMHQEHAALLGAEQVMRAQQEHSLQLQERIIKAKGALHEVERAQKQHYEAALLGKQQELDALTMAVKELTLIFEQQSKQQVLLKKQRVDLAAKYQALLARRQSHEAAHATYQATKQQFEKRRTYYQLFLQRRNDLQEQLKELAEKGGTMKETSDPSCPLCEQVLTVRRKQFLCQKFEHEATALQRKCDRLSGIIVRLKEILIAQHAQIQQMDGQETLRHKEVQECAHLEQQLALAQTEEERLDGEVALLGQRRAKQEQELAQRSAEQVEAKRSCEEALRADEKVRTVLAAQVALEKELHAISYDRAAHKELVARCDALQKTLMEWSALQSELARQDDRKKRIADLAQELRAERVQVQELGVRLQKLGVTEQTERALAERLQQAKLGLQTTKKQEQELLRLLGSIDSELARIEILKKESKDRRERALALQQEINDFQILSTAFGKDGMQALLIEEAIPEIEEEANALLSRLTDNNAQIFIESLRDLKKGGVKETLDIHIADAAGIRPYEMFSGGEAFRIDFALRIAISKLLARRAGTALETLIIDEGFGSQDEEGLSRLMSAIHAIQGDFARIIVVSHLPILKENFPVHLMIEKTPSGSTVNFVERG